MKVLSKGYALYKDGQKVFEGNVADCYKYLGLSSDNMLFYYARKGYYKDFIIEKVMVDSCLFRLYEYDVLVGENMTANDCLLYLKEKGYNNKSASSIYLSEQRKSTILDRFHVVKMGAVVDVSAYANAIEKEFLTIVSHLEKYGNTIICGRNKEKHLKRIREQFNINERKITEGRHYHYVIERV